MEYKSTKEEIFDSIYRSYAVEVYRACLHLTKNDDLAQEMTQQAFVNFYERFEETKPECIKAYLIRSARNLVYNYYRHAKYEVQDNKNEDVELEKVQVTDSLEDNYFQNERRTMEQQLSADILLDLQKNHEAWYDIINMMFYLDKSHDEICEELGISKEVLYSRLHRAKLWIRKKYGTEFEKISDTS